MKPILLLFAFLMVTGCESEIDKCVDAQAVQTCNQPTTSLNGYQAWWEFAHKNEEECLEDLKKTNAGNWRLLCLNAQAGKK
jgi:hypothetical protein